MVEINFPTLILQCINFLVLVWLLKKFLYKPVLNFLDKRSKEIKDKLEESEKLREEAKRLSEVQQEKMVQAKKEALNIIKRAKNSANQESDRIIYEAKQRAESVIKNTKKQIEAEAQEQKELLIKKIGSLSIELSEKIIRKELQSENIDYMTEEFIKDLQKTE